MKELSNERKVFLIRNVSPKSFGGAEIYQILLAKQLKKNGLKPIIFSNSEGLLKMANRSAICTENPPYIPCQNWSGWRNLLLPIYFSKIFRMSRWYLKKMTEYQPEIVNVQSRDDWLAATMAARRKHIKVIWTDHADFKNWVLWNVSLPFKNIIGKMIIRMSKYAQKVIFISDGVLRETKKMIAPFKIQNATIIANGVINEYGNYKYVNFLAQSMVYTGRIENDKGIFDLINAFLKVHEDFPDATLNIYGEGEALDECKKMARGIHQIKFHGFTNEPLKAISENEIFVLPSYREGLSLSLLDAAMLEKKIIATNVDGNPEVVEDGKTGLLVPPRNVQALASAMRWMLKNPREANRLAQNARRKYEQEFNFEKIFDEKMLPLYNKGKA